MAPSPRCSTRRPVPPAAEVVEARGLHVLPGLIDTHVHTRHPGVPAREDFASGTAAAAAGGITTIFEMPIAKVPANSADAVRARVAAMTPGAHIDFALYGGAGHENIDRLTEQAGAGVIAFKTFLQPPRLPASTSSSDCGVPTTRGCATSCARWRRRDAAIAFTASTRRSSKRSRPGSKRTAARVAGPTPRAGRRSSRNWRWRWCWRWPPTPARRSGSCTRRARARPNWSLTRAPAASTRRIETCPPYLWFTGRRARPSRPRSPSATRRCASADEVARLWRALDAGRIDYLGTDHSPFLAEDKAASPDNIFRAPPGLCGLELLAPLMLTAVGDGRLTLPRLAALCATRAAHVFGLPAKGRIAAGADADLALVDLEARWTYDSGRALTRSRANMAIYDGLALHGRVVSTFVRGRRVFTDGEIVGRARAWALRAPQHDYDHHVLRRLQHHTHTVSRRWPSRPRQHPAADGLHARRGRRRHDHSRRARRSRRAHRARARRGDHAPPSRPRAPASRSVSAPRTPAPMAASPTAATRTNWARPP